MTHERSWSEARAAAWAAAHPLPRISQPLARCLGHLLGEPLIAKTDLPAFDTSAMDGWAVAGDGPWKVYGTVLAGEPAAALAAGEAVEIATGARVPPGATAVLRSEHGVLDGTSLSGTVDPGGNIRRRGEECSAGDLLLPAAARVTPAVVGLAAAAGFDELSVVNRPDVWAFVVGDELLHSGLPHGSHIRDALGPLLAGWLTQLGARTCDVRHVPDTHTALIDAVRGSSAHVIVTTGGTAHGPADHLRSVLAELGSEVLVDGVRVRPGHPMLLARLDGGVLLVGLPGNPLAAVTGVVTLLAPVIAALLGEPALPCHRVRLAEAATGHPVDTRIIPVMNGVPVRLSGPAMLRGLASADALAVIPPGGAERKDEVEVLPLPWAAPAY
ncbi:MAG TPA: molybdopterin molybdotransferase MoeA [Jiangellaceae bacterium]